MILAGDIGGTNTTLALVDHDNGLFTIADSRRYSSSELSGLQEALGDFLSGGRRAKVDLCCLSAAGPVQEGTCVMTNVQWTIDAREIEELVGVQTHIINDFSAICYALPLIDTHPQIHTLEIPHPDGSTPRPNGSVRAVVGAGTGLGTGFLIEDRGHYTAHPSEGGHSAFSPEDEDMLLLQSFLNRRFRIRPGAEQYISGQGIRNIYLCMREAGRIPLDELTRQIDSAPAPDLPGLVAGHAAERDDLGGVMKLFVRMYAQYASNTALFLLPTGGLYLAGGIAAKNEEWLFRDNLFMSTFERNYNERISPLLRTMPVVLIKDYSVSLYGAAHAAISLV